MENIITLLVLIFLVIIAMTGFVIAVGNSRKQKK